MRLNLLIANWRWANRITMRQAAREIGLTVPTLVRVERGEKMSAETLGKILVWMMKEAA